MASPQDPSTDHRVPSAQDYEEEEEDGARESESYDEGREREPAPEDSRAARSSARPPPLVPLGTLLYGQKGY